LWPCHFIPLHGMLADEALSGLMILWPCHFIPLHGMLIDEALSGLSYLCRLFFNPEGAASANDGYSPSEKKIKNKVSPERAIY